MAERDNDYHTREQKGGNRSDLFSRCGPVGTGKYPETQHDAYPSDAQRNTTVVSALLTPPIPIPPPPSPLPLVIPKEPVTNETFAEGSEEDQLK